MTMANLFIYRDANRQIDGKRPYYIGCWESVCAIIDQEPDCGVVAGPFSTLEDAEKYLMKHFRQEKDKPAVE